MNSPVCVKVDQVLTHLLSETQRLAAALQSEDWDELNRIQRTYQEAFDQAVTALEHDAPAASHAALLEEIKAATEQLLQLSKARQINVADRMHTLNTGKKARAAYKRPTS